MKKVLINLRKGSVLLLLALLILAAKNSFADGLKLITNKHENNKIPVTEISQKELTENVYDLSFVAYDKKFADEFGLKQELVTVMDKGLRFLEVKMITEGKQTNCYYNLVLDKSVEVAFPSGKNYFFDNNPKIDIDIATIVLPTPEDPSYKKKVELMKKKKSLFKNSTIEIMHQYTNHLYVGTQDYQKDKPRAKNGAFVNYYIQDRLNYKILSMRGYCSLDANVFEIPKPSIWVAKDNLDYNTVVNVSSDHFNKFLIPESITKQFTPIILEFQKSGKDSRRLKEEERKKMLNKDTVTKNNDDSIHLMSQDILMSLLFWKRNSE